MILRMVKDSPGVIGWFVVVFAMTLAFFWQYQIAKDVEEVALTRSLLHCETQNEIKGVMWHILVTAQETSLSVDTVEEIERRQEFMDTVYPTLEPIDCSMLIDAPPPYPSKESTNGS